VRRRGAMELPARSCSSGDNGGRVTERVCFLVGSEQGRESNRTRQGRLTRNNGKSCRFALGGVTRTGGNPHRGVPVRARRGMITHLPKFCFAIEAAWTD